MTHYNEKSTTFYKASFFEGNDLYFVAAHELRHLFKANYDLYAPKKDAYLRALVSGRDISDFPHEIDADSWQTDS